MRQEEAAYGDERAGGAILQKALVASLQIIVGRVAAEHELIEPHDVIERTADCVHDPLQRLKDEPRLLLDGPDVERSPGLAACLRSDPADEVGSKESR